MAPVIAQLIARVRRGGCALAVAVGAAAAFASTPAERVIEVAPGESQTLVFNADIGTALVTNPATANVELLDQRKLFVLGVAVGITSLQVHGLDGGLLGAWSVRVQAQPAYADAVASSLGGDAGDIEVEAIGDALFVTGEAKSPAQAERLLRGIRAVSGDATVVDAISLEGPAQVNLEVVISEVSRNITQELGIDWSLDINPFSDPLRTLVRGIRVATGGARVEPVWDQTLQFQTLLPDGQVVPRSTINTDELGVVVPTLGGDGGIVLTRHTTFGPDSRYRATAFLEALAQNGLATVHARPNLTAVSGQPAEFASGLEIPVPTATERGLLATEYIETGVNLKFTPLVLDDGQISLTVEPRIREVTTGGAVIAGTQVPNINQRSASTTVEVGDGESIAIAGLYRRSTTSTRSGVPLLSDIPVWGALFRNTRTTDRSVELIIIVTPYIVAALGSPSFASAGTETRADSARQLGNEFYY